MLLMLACRCESLFRLRIKRVYSESDAHVAVELKNGFSIGTKQIKVSFARPASDFIKNCKLYCTSLPLVFTEDDVYNLFSQVSKQTTTSGEDLRQ